MLFHEPIFLYAFLPATLAAFLVLQSYGATAGAAWLLLMSSMLFYGWWDPRLLPLLAASITFNYFFGLVLVRRAASKSNILLALGIASNLGLLGRNVSTTLRHSWRSIGEGLSGLGVSFHRLIRVCDRAQPRQGFARFARRLRRP